MTCPKQGDNDRDFYGSCTLSRALFQETFNGIAWLKRLVQKTYVGYMQPQRTVPCKTNKELKERHDGDRGCQEADQRTSQDLLDYKTSPTQILPELPRAVPNSCPLPSYQD